VGKFTSVRKFASFDPDFLFQDQDNAGFQVQEKGKKEKTTKKIQPNLMSTLRADVLQWTGSHTSNQDKLQPVSNEELFDDHTVYNGRNLSHSHVRGNSKLKGKGEEGPDANPYSDDELDYKRPCPTSTTWQGLRPVQVWQQQVGVGIFSAEAWSQSNVIAAPVEADWEEELQDFFSNVENQTAWTAYRFPSEAEALSRAQANAAVSSSMNNSSL